MTSKDLIYKWELKEVQYKDGRKAFVPQSYGGFTLHLNGTIGWNDGCNAYCSKYQIEGDKISISPLVASTNIGCDFEIEDVHYTQVIHYLLEEQTLFLHTPEQIYVLEKFPYSRISMNAWSLYSIVVRQTGVEFNVDRFRTDYYHLFLRIEKDKFFYFTDLDRDEFTGSLQVEGNTILRMSYDQMSQKRLQNKPKQQDYLADNTQSYKKTQERYPTTYAHKLDWEAIKSFEFFEELNPVLPEEMEITILQFYSETHLYKFIPR